MNKCNHCERETTNPKYCSRSCAASVNNKLSPKRTKTLKCSTDGCDTYVAAGYTYCAPCFKLITEVKDMALVDAIYERHHKSSAYALVRSRARKSVRDEPKVCVKCGYDKHVEVCHIKPIKDFELTAMLSEINSRSNLILLCPNCHWELDNL